MKAKILHNPRCSKSRETLHLLEQHGIEPDIVLYLETPPTKADLTKLLKLLGLRPRELMRRNEPEYRDHHLDDTTLTDAQLIDAMVAHPRLIERPIVIVGNRAIIGRPPEKVLEILSGE